MRIMMNLHLISVQSWNVPEWRAFLHFGHESKDSMKQSYESYTSPISRSNVGIKDNLGSVNTTDVVSMGSFNLFWVLGGKVKHAISQEYNGANFHGFVIICDLQI